MTASERRNRLAWFEILLIDCQLLLGCPPPAPDISQQFDVSIRVRRKPVLKLLFKPFSLCRLPVESGGSSVCLLAYEASDPVVRGNGVLPNCFNLNGKGRLHQMQYRQLLVLLDACDPNLPSKLPKGVGLKSLNEAREHGLVELHGEVHDAKGTFNAEG